MVMYYSDWLCQYTFGYNVRHLSKCANLVYNYVNASI